MIVLAIDQGTSGTKAIVVDGTGQVLALAEAPVRPVYLPDGGVEQDPEALLASVLDAGRRALEVCGAVADCVALANQGETVLAWDPATGQPLSPAIVWQDSRSESVCAEMREHADELATRTGLVLDPDFSAPKMAWLRRHVTTEGVVTTSDFELGAVDYVSKPYLSAEILARVATHLRLHQLHSELERQNAELREESARREALVQQLGASLERVKLLSGIIPICAHCRKVRDDRGYWQQVEDFVEAHSAALFSHSLCVECCERYYPDENNG